MFLNMCVIWHLQSSTNNQAEAGKPPAFLTEMEFLFGGTPFEGTLISCGGIPLPKPSAGNPQNAPHTTPSPGSQPTPQSTPMTTPSPLSPRTRKEHSSILRKRKSPGLEGYVKQISESISMRCDKRLEEKNEIARAVKIVEDDGLKEGSELHGLAMLIFSNNAKREILFNLKTPEGRRNWLKFELAEWKRKCAEQMMWLSRPTLFGSFVLLLYVPGFFVCTIMVDVLNFNGVM